MADMHNADDPIEHNPLVAHEEKDINIRAVLWIVAISVVFAVVIHVAMWGLYEFFRKQENSKAGPPITLVREGKPETAPEPRLQPFPPALQAYPEEDRNKMPNTPAVDMSAMTKRENETLGSWGWADKASGRVHMPIDQAMAIALQRGFPVNAGAAAPAAGAVAVPAEPGPAGNAQNPVNATSSTTVPTSAAQPQAAPAPVQR